MKNTSSGNPGRRLSWQKKLAFGLIVCASFLVALEGMLFIVGVKPLASEIDLGAGFSSRFALFTLQKNSQGQLVYATAPHRLHLFNPQEFPQHKSPNSYRIFCLGGSTTYGRPYHDGTSFSGFLREALPEIDSSRQWEVINAGGISYASPRIAILMKELVTYEPDLFILYTGHNEFLEDRTYASFQQTPAIVRDAGGVAAHSRLYSVMHRALKSGNQGTKKDPDAGEIEEVDAILDRSIGPEAYHRDEAWQTRVHQEFRQNLELIISQARAVGAEVMLVTPAANLRDCSPFKSEHQPGITPQDLHNFQLAFNSAETGLSEENSEEAGKQIQQALVIDPRHAEARFLAGKIAWQQQDFPTAAEAFQLALEEDVCPLRASRSIIDIVRKTAEEQRVSLVDFVSLIAEQAEHQIPGDDWFLDHVHPTVEGHRLLARLLCTQLISAQVLQAGENWEENAFQPAADRVVARIDATQHAVALRNLAKVLSWAGKVQEADRLAQRAAEMLPGDAESQTMSGSAAYRTGDYVTARKHFEEALRLEPGNVRALNGMGSLCSLEGDLETAKEYFLEVLRIDAANIPAWFNLGNAHRELGAFQDALDCYNTSLKLEPQQADVHKNMGLVLVQMGQLDAAVVEFELALKLEPDSAARHAELGFVLIDAQDLFRAQMEFETALQIQPDHVPAMLGVALLLHSSGNVSEALATIKQALQIEPENPALLNLLTEWE